MKHFKRNSLLRGAGLLGVGLLGVVQLDLVQPRADERQDRYDRRDDRDWDDDDDRRDDDRWRNRDRDNNTSRGNSDFSTMEGVVSNDTINNRTFHLLLDSGGQITVQLQGGVPDRIGPGDRVRIYGRASNGVFRAQNLTILSDRGSYGSRDRDRYNRRDNRDSNRDDRYQRERYNRERYNQRGGNNQRDNNRRNTTSRGNSDFSTMEGVVSNDTINNRTFHLLLDSGGQITVQLQGGVPDRIGPGDRVRIYGRASNGVFRAQNLVVLRNR